MRTRMTAAQTAAAVTAYVINSARFSRCKMGFSWRPTRMNARTFSTKTTTSQTAYDGIRSRAGDHDREDDDGDDAGESQALGDHPNGESRQELDDDRSGHVLDPVQRTQ